MSERYFECTGCKAVVQGWNAAHWWGRWHENNCPGGEIVEVNGPDDFELCGDPECDHLGCIQQRQEDDYRAQAAKRDAALPVQFSRGRNKLFKT